jgi:hypothetical protein
MRGKIKVAHQLSHKRQYKRIFMNLASW